MGNCDDQGYNSMAKIAILIPTLNEAPRIEECVKQFKPHADFILVYDTGSTDNTPDIALKAEADAVILRGKTGGQDKDRNMGCSMIPQGINWVLISDADERFPEEFLKDMHTLIEDNAIHSFRLPRNNFGRRFNWPDYQVKLVKRWVEWRGHPHCLPYDPIRGIKIDNVSCLTLDKYEIQHLPRRSDIEREWWKTEPVE